MGAMRCLAFAMRISSVPPSVGASGKPEFGPDDAFFLSEFCCKHNDLSLFNQVLSEQPEGKDFSSWHSGARLGMQFDDVPALRLESAPPTLRSLIAQLEEAFGIETSACRLNRYRSKSDFKPLHCDKG
eukprot:4700646-Karenia_brevis.AAC.1